MKDKFEELHKIKVLRKLLFIEEDTDVDSWEVTRAVKDDLRIKIKWARYGYQMALNQFEELSD